MVFASFAFIFHKLNVRTANNLKIHPSSPFLSNLRQQAAEIFLKF